MTRLLALIPVAFLLAATPLASAESTCAVVLKNGKRFPCAEPPVIAFGRVTYRGADGTQRVIAAELVELEKTRAACGQAEKAVTPPAGPPAGAIAQPAAVMAAVGAPGGQQQLRVAPDFDAVTVKGEVVKLSQLRGKVVLVDFWATWCGPCIQEMPSIKKLHQALAGPEFEIVGVSLDHDKGRFEKFVKSESLNWPQNCAGAGWASPVSRSYGVSSIPTTVLLDREGRIVRTGLRGPALEPAARALIEQTRAAKKG